MSGNTYSSMIDKHFDPGRLTICTNGRRLRYCSYTLVRYGHVEPELEGKCKSVVDMIDKKVTVSPMSLVYLVEKNYKDVILGMKMNGATVDDTILRK